MTGLPCSLHTIRVQVIGESVIHLCHLHTSERAAALRSIHGVLEGVVTETGWMIIHHPEKGDLGLPLNGEHGSWHRVWDDLKVKIFVCTSQGWTDIEDDWDLVHAAAQHY